MKKNSTHILLLLVACALPGSAQRANSRWIESWGAAPMGQTVEPGAPAPDNSTYRNIVHVSTGGTSVRIQLTNEFGVQSLTIGAVHIAVSSGKDRIQPESDHELSFGGKDTVIIPAGGVAFSDPVPMQISALSDLAISVYLPQQQLNKTNCHEFAGSTNFVTQGDTTIAAALAAPRLIYAWCFVKAVEVNAQNSKSATIATFGDSITDGWQSTRDANMRWPDVLARRLQQNKNTSDLSVLNEGISGNRLLRDGVGANAIARFDRDILAHSSIKYLILLEGINDIGMSSLTHEPAEKVSVADIIFAYSQLITRAHQHGIKIYGATLLPYMGGGYASKEGEKTRQEINQWIRSTGNFDGFIDFDKVVRDPSNPTVLLPAMDSGDHVHPSDAGYKAMGEAIPLSLFR